jgi:hypothetical protein
MHDALKINRVSSMTALVNSLMQQVNKKFPGSTTTASQMLARGREPDSMAGSRFQADDERSLPAKSTWMIDAEVTSNAVSHPPAQQFVSMHSRC